MVVTLTTQVGTAAVGNVIAGGDTFDVGGIVADTVRVVSHEPLTSFG